MAITCQVILCMTLVMLVTSDDIEDEIRRLKDEYARLERDLATISRQSMMQQFYVEEQARSNGDSGVKTIRNRQHGTRPYDSATQSDNRVNAIHNHAHNIRTIGMGEVVAVINGVEFRTRHNDFRLMQKENKTNSKYGATEKIIFPPVPPEVTAKLEVSDQIAEMKEFFRAFKNQDPSHRDYRPYFRPVLCYMEGAWTKSDQNKIEEPFSSDRHNLDAKSWLDMQDKIRYTSYTGLQDGAENFAYLPTTIIDMINDTRPLLAQWNYKILCHPLKNDLPLNRFNLIDDLAARAYNRYDIDEYASSRAARFQLSPENKDEFRPRAMKYSFLDELMAEVPGPDGYQGDLTDTSLNQVVYPPGRKATDPLNVAFYNRAYTVRQLGAQGTTTRQRGYIDQNLFVAQTKHDKIAGIPVEKCVKKNGIEECKSWNTRSSYAIPLEILFMTPLTNWNPYDIVYKGDANTPWGKTVVEGKRNGEEGPKKAYNGTNSKIYYRTPLEFFQGEKNEDAADTARDSAFVLDSENVVRQVRASGHRVVLPEISGVGLIRQRYPIVHLHGEGESVWKELAALTDMVLDPSNFRYLFNRESVPVTGSFDSVQRCIEPEDICSPSKK